VIGRGGSHEKGAKTARKANAEQSKKPQKKRNGAVRRFFSLKPLPPRNRDRIALATDFRETKL
jgi:hypothetical protein